MNKSEVQPEASGTQEAGQEPVAKLGLLDEGGLADLLKSGFLDEKEVVPTSEEQKQEEQEEQPEETQDETTESSGQSEEPEEDEEDHSSLSRGVQKRINKLVAAKKAAQAEIEAQKQTLEKLQAELNTAKAQKPQEKLDPGVLAIDSLEKVNEEHKKAVDVILWCEENPDGGLIELPDGKEVEISSSEVRAMKRTAIKRKEVDLPARYQFLQQQDAVEKEVVKDFPFFNKPETEEYRISQQIINEFPELKQKRADWKHVVGLVVLGLQKYNENKSAKKVAPVKRAPAQPSVKAPPTVIKNDGVKAKQAFAKDTSDKQGLTDLVKAMGFV